MQIKQCPPVKRDYPIEDLLDFLKPTFPNRCESQKGFGMYFNGDKKGAVAVQRQLILMLEEWIRTGFQADGSEMLEERNFAPKQNYGASRFALYPPPEALVAIADYLKGHLMVTQERGGETVYVIHGVGILTVEVGPKGGLEYKPSTSHQTDPKMIAASFFTEFYRSKWLFNLVQCRRCRKFSVPESKPRQRFERGWHCPKCSHIAPKEVRRASQREKLVRLTVEACERWDAMPQSKQLGERVVWLASKVNESLPLADRVTRNTITRILNDIAKNSNQTGPVLVNESKPATGSPT